jgi:hypothetical protein
MNFPILSDVRFGDIESLHDMLFENQDQHTVFRSKLLDMGFFPPSFPLTDIDVDQIDDWMLNHQVEHQYFAGVLGLENPFNMLDADWRKEADFNDWVSQHYLIHAQIAQTLGIQING